MHRGDTLGCVYVLASTSLEGCIGLTAPGAGAGARHSIAEVLSSNNEGLGSEKTGASGETLGEGWVLEAKGGKQWLQGEHPVATARKY